MRYIIAILVILIAFLGVVVLFRLPADTSIPVAELAPAPTALEVLQRAKAYRYTRGVYGGTLRMRMGDDLQTFNAVLSTDAVSSEILGWMYEGLLARDRVTYAFEPRLAAEMPRQVDDEGLVYEIRLREDVKWFDGEGFDADDVVFTVNRILYNTDIRTSWRYSWQLSDTDPETGQQVTRQVKVEKVDRYTVRFTLPYRWAYLNEALLTGIMPEHVLRRVVDEGKFNEHWGLMTPPREVIGCGPYRVKSYQFGERLVLERNPDYYRVNEFGDRMPYINEIIYTVIQEGSVARDYFLEGRLDFTGVRGTDFKDMYRQQDEKGFTIYRRGPATGTRFIVFNMNPRKDPEGNPYVAPHKLAWFRDRRFRRAIAHSIDRHRIRKSIFHGFAFLQDSPVSSANTRFFTGYFPEPLQEQYPIVRYEYDLSRASALLDEMGLGQRDEEGYRYQEVDGQRKRVEFLINTYAQSKEYEKIASIIKEDLERIGVKVNFQAVPFPTLVRKLMREWNWETIIIGLTGGYADPLNGGRNVWPTDGNLHMWNPKMENAEGAFPWELELNRIFETAQKTPSYEGRQRLVAEFQHIISREAPVIYTVNEEAISAVRDRFGNFNPTIYSLIDFMMIYDRSLANPTDRAEGD